jgi:hypothetical protein
MKRAWYIGAATVVIMLAVVALGTAETVVTVGGSVLQGEIEFGIPGVISVTSATGDVFTVQRTNLKAIRFPAKKGEDFTVETFDGNILIGTVGGIPEVIGLRTSGGDVQSVKLTSIQEIRFEQPPAPSPSAPTATPSQPTTVAPAPSGALEILAEGVREAYGQGRWAFTFGLDTGFQLGVSTRNGFGYPTASLGVNLLGLGALWRTYFVPPPWRIEETALEIATETPSITLDDLIVATADATRPGSSFYLELGTRWLILPEIGIGWLFRLGDLIYFDAGASIDIALGPWVSLGFLFIF